MSHSLRSKSLGDRDRCAEFQGIARIENDAALTRVQILEEGTRLVRGEVLPGRGPSAHCIAAGLLDLDGHCAGVDEELAGVGARDLRGEIENPKTVEGARKFFRHFQMSSLIAVEASSKNLTSIA